jgi:hypothetical protein
LSRHGRWSIVLDPHASGTYGADWLSHWEGDGILAFIEHPRLATAVRCAGIPAIELLGHRLDLGPLSSATTKRLLVGWVNDSGANASIRDLPLKHESLS